LFESHHEAIQSYCFRRLPASDANDAVAEVFLVAWRRISDAPIGHGELPWLYGIGRNVVANARRSARRSGRLRIRLANVSSEHDPGPEIIVVRNAEEREALEALARLRPEDQEIIRLRTWEELPNEQIASIMGLSVRAVESRLTRARRKLERMLETPSTATSKARPLPAENGGGER
jgi:RNA polymerase sigma-70 factor (ECF subfamily)